MMPRLTDPVSPKGLCLVAVGQQELVQPIGIYGDKGQIGLGIAAYRAGFVLPTVSQCHADGLGPVDDVVVGDDQPALGVDDETAAQAGLAADVLFQPPPGLFPIFPRVRLAPSLQQALYQRLGCRRFGLDRHHRGHDQLGDVASRQRRLGHLLRRRHRLAQSLEPALLHRVGHVAYQV